MKHDEITEDYLWARLEPLLGYLPLNDRRKVRDALDLAYFAHTGQVSDNLDTYTPTCAPYGSSVF